jgi:carbamoyltransferase
MNVLGINAYHGDSAACLLVDGEVIAAVEEERFNRIKHWAGFPVQAIDYCLREGGLTLAGIDHVAVNRNPRASLLHKALYVLRRAPRLALLRDRVRNALAWLDIPGALGNAFPGQRSRAQVHHVEHHMAHVASSFLVSPFDQAALLSVDGFGDFSSTMLAVGRASSIECLYRIRFPVSLGVFYQAVTQHLGFPHYGDEYKVMGLAPYGEPRFLEAMRTIAPYAGGWKYALEMNYFRHGKEQLGYTWRDEAPKVGRLFSERVERLLGPKRDAEAPLEQRHKDIARSLQARYEEIFLGIVRELKSRTKLSALCLSGGCAANSVANGKVLEKTGFTEVYIPAAAGDSGGAVGAAARTWALVTGKRPAPMRHANLGPEYSPSYANALLSRMEGECRDAQVERLWFADADELCRTTAGWIDRGLVVGWFQGRMEWGPRALGNRSILCDPRRADMKEILNRKIKRRESFRPFAPSILREAVSEYFEVAYDVPFMSQVFTVIPAKRSLIPAVVHVDGTGRLQTVAKADQPLYWTLIEAFRHRTGIPLLLNTSFNENEPIVNRPEEALECFLRTSMDVLVLLDTVLIRQSAMQGTN